MKFLLLVKTFLLTNKLMALGIAVLILIVGGSIAYANFGTQTTVLGVNTEKQPEITVTISPTLSISSGPTTIPTPKISITSAGKTPTPTTGAATPTSTTTNQTNSSVTNTPTLTPTQIPAAKPYLVNGVTFNSAYPTLTIKPGEQKTLFTMTASGNKNFTVTDFRLIGSNGLSLSAMSGSIANGETKEIMLIANSDATPGTYSGFIGVSIDGVFYDQPLRPTVIVEGSVSANAQSLKLTGPAGGSVYKIGDDIVITWDASNISGNFDLSVQGDNGVTEGFANVDNSQRSYTWKANKMFAPTATHFRFTLTGGSLISHSDSDIIINNY